MSAHRPLRSGVLRVALVIVAAIVMAPVLIVTTISAAGGRRGR